MIQKVSAAEYIPPYLAGKSSVIHPAIDPLSHKNRELSAHKLVGILCNAGLMKSRHPVLTPDWEHPVLRLHPDGRFLPAHDGGGVGLMFRPVVTQVSRWDRLKGWMPLLEGFGLTATEAMWKRVPVLGSSACGLRLQIRDRIDGRLTSHPQDPHEIAETLDEMLSNPVQRELFGRSAQRRVYDRFLVFTQVESWLRRLAEAASTPRSSVSAK